jgi:AraC family L-rhamnose operon regulatory protein RhaS
MARRTPVYIEQGRLHQADTCRPLVEAVARGDLRLEALARGSYPGRRLPAGVVPQVRSVGYWDAAREQRWGLEEHRNEGVELTCLEGGRIAFRAGGRSWGLRAGDLTVTRPWQPHQVGNPHVGAGRLHWVILDVGVRRPHQPWSWPRWVILPPDDLRDLTRMLRRNERPVWRGTPEVGRCFADIGRLVASGAGAAVLRTRLALLINELLVCVLEMLRARGVREQASLATAERTTEMFLRELESSLERPWTLDAMADCAGLKRTRFAHYVRKLTNRSPLEHLAQLRVQRAKRMIASRPGASLTDVALACGFASSQYFATVFRKIEGAAPREYRARGVSPRRSGHGTGGSEGPA